MITLSSADNALKTFYLDAMTESLNMKVNPLLAKVARTSDYVTGKEVCKTMRVGINGGIGAGNLKEVLAAGVDVIVAGSAIFGAADPVAAAAAMREIEKAL